MKIGILASPQSLTAEPDLLPMVGRTADEGGLHSLWVADHVLLFDEYSSRYPFNSSGRYPAQASTLLEPFGVLSYFAGITSRIRLGTGVCVIPQRNPVYTAKSVATVDWMSGGRFDFGIGVGWLEEEFRAVDAPFEKRGERSRAYIDVMRSLWCDDTSEHHSEYYDLPKCRQFPKPLQKPYPPLHFGGDSAAALRRVADLGEGWFGYLTSPEAVERHMGTLTPLLTDRGRARSDITASVTPPGRTVTLDMMHRYADVGIDQIIVALLEVTRDGILAELDRLAAMVDRVA